MTKWTTIIENGILDIIIYEVKSSHTFFENAIMMDHSAQRVAGVLTGTWCPPPPHTPLKKESERKKTIKVMHKLRGSGQETAKPLQFMKHFLTLCYKCYIIFNFCYCETLIVSMSGKDNSL